MKQVSSRDNAHVKRWRRLAQDNGSYRKHAQVWLEGDHLCQAALARGVTPLEVVLCESVEPAAAASWAQHATEVYVIPAPFQSISALDSPARIAMVVSWRAPPPIDPHAPSVVLDRLQDAGNVGAILRSASAMGFKQILALKGTAALWSSKVLRAGMGAHFGLQLLEGLDAAELASLTLPLLTTSVHQGPYLHTLQAQHQLPDPCAWILGHEGQGVSQELQELAHLQVRIAQPGGEESLNVAAAAAICLHASATARLGPPG